MKQDINVFDYAETILKAVPHGVLLTTMVNEDINTMTIGWGTLGVEWNKPVFVAYVREGRYTRELLEKNPEFTINVPLDHDEAKKILIFCGSHSGREVNKVKEAGLTKKTPRTISVPGIKEAPLTLECKILYAQKQDHTLTDHETVTKFYPQDVPSEAVGANRDDHIAFYAEIVDAYILK